MKANIFIPKTIKVGFQNRNDTYTKKLAYIIYYDQKGKLRKEVSWDSWRDKKIPDLEFSNEPISGFVLNKKVGDYVSDWNHRQAYVRVYDPRDFEFEITIENLLYILENASSIKGKGLDGDFVYGWDGKNLILIPTESPDYTQISQFNKIIHQNNYIKSKDLILGATYKTKTNEEWIYMGRFDYHDTKYESVYKEGHNSWYNSSYDYVYTNINKGKYYYFAREYKYKWNNKTSLEFLKLKSLGDKFIAISSVDCVDNYAELFGKLECTTDYSPLDKNKDEYIPYTLEEFNSKVLNNNGFPCYDFKKDNRYVRKSSNITDQYVCEFKNDYNKPKITGTIEDIFNNIQPMHKKEYLENGKLFSDSGGYYHG
jgi:hypothetical protein